MDIPVGRSTVTHELPARPATIVLGRCDSTDLDRRRDL